MTDDMDKTAIGSPPYQGPANSPPYEGGAGGGEATQMLSQPAAEATQYAVNVTCPVCQTPNPPSETYCIDCGFVLASEPVAAAEMPETPSVGSFVTSDGTREFLLKPGENTVGRQDADVLLAHNSVSRSHAKVTVEGGKVLVEDVGSTNGTTVDGKRLGAGERVELADGAEVVFGSQALRFKVGMGNGEEGMEGTADAGEESADEPVDVSPAEETQPEAEAVEDEDSLLQHPTPITQHPAARLVSADSSMSFDLFEGVSTVGRRDGNDIVILDAYCSGKHAEVSAQDGAFTVTDLGSTNGTMVNGVKLEPNAPRAVQAGDEITFGQTVFKIEAPE